MLEIPGREMTKHRHLHSLDLLRHAWQRMAGRVGNIDPEYDLFHDRDDTTN